MATQILNNGYRVHFTATYAGYSPNTQEANVAYKLSMESTLTGYSYRSLSDSYSITIDGKSASGGAINELVVTSGSATTIANGTVKVSQPNGAARTITCKATLNLTVQSGEAPPGTCPEISFSLSLPASTQNSNVAVPGVQSGTKYFGTAFNLVMTGTRPGYTYRAVYRADWQSGQTTITNVNGVSGGTYSITIPYTAAPPNRKSCVVNINLQTLRNGTEVGARHTSFTLYCKDSECIPTLGAISFRENNSAVNTLAVNNPNIGYIQGVSSLDILCSATAKNNATIATQKYYVDGTEVKSNFTPKRAGTLTVKTIATDSRGYSIEKSTTISVKAYDPPKITSFKLRREDVNGELTESGNRLGYSATFNFSIPANSGNKLTVIFYYGTSATSRETYSTRPSESPYSAVPDKPVTGQFSNGINSSSSYYGRLIIKDDLGYTIPMDADLSPRAYPITFGERSVAIGGMTSSGGEFECFLPSVFTNTVRHDNRYFIDGMKQYRICCGNITINSGITSTTLGGGSIAQSNYFTASVIRAALGLSSSDSITSENTMLFVQNASTGGGGLAWNAKWNAQSNSTSGQFVVFSNTGTNASSIKSVRLNYMLVRYA